MNELDTILTPLDGFCIRKLGQETIFLANKGDVIHSLDETGSFIWNAIDGKKTLADIAALLCLEFEVSDATAQADLLAFARELAEKKIVSLGPAG